MKYETIAQLWNTTKMKYENNIIIRLKSHQQEHLQTKWSHATAEKRKTTNNWFEKKKLSRKKWVVFTQRRLWPKMIKINKWLLFVIILSLAQSGLAAVGAYENVIDTLLLEQVTRNANDLIVRWLFFIICLFFFFSPIATNFRGQFCRLKLLLLPTVYCSIDYCLRSQQCKATQNMRKQMNSIDGRFRLRLLNCHCQVEKEAIKCEQTY